MKDWIPEGWHSVTPRLVADDPAALVEFLRRAFEAVGAFHQDRPSEMTLGDSIVMISGCGPRDSTRAFSICTFQMSTRRSLARSRRAP
jgi:hypothetical protein